MDVEKEMREYQAIQGWLHGKKPPAAGRTWRRIAAAVVHTGCSTSYGGSLGTWEGMALA